MKKQHKRDEQKEKGYKFLSTTVNNEFQKHCPSCDTTLPATLEFYYKDKYTKSGLNSECKECSVKRNKTARMNRNKIKNDTM